MERVLLVVEVLDVADDPAFVLEFPLARLLGPFVAQGDREAPVEKRELSQSLLQNVPVEIARLEDLRIRLEPLVRPGRFRRSEFLELLHRLAAFAPVLVFEAVALDARHHRLGEGVDDRDPDAVQPPGDLVAALTELSAGVQHRHHDLDGRHLLLGVDIDRDTAAVVLDRARSVLIEDDLYFRRVARQRLVDCVVDGLVHELMEPAFRGVPDVHTRALADRFEPAQYFDVFASIVVHSYKRVMRSSPRMLRTTAGVMRCGSHPVCRSTYELAILRSRPSSDTRPAALARDKSAHQRSKSACRIRSYSSTVNVSMSAAAPQKPSHGASYMSRCTATSRSAAIEPAQGAQCIPRWIKTPQRAQDFHPCARFACRFSSKRSRIRAGASSIEAAGASSGRCGRAAPRPGGAGAPGPARAGVRTRPTRKRKRAIPRPSLIRCSARKICGERSES